MEPSRSCYICLAEEPEAEVDAAEWVSPCRCSGTMAWVHKGCILRWVQVQELESAGPVNCPSCGTAFILTPGRSVVIRAIHFLQSSFYPWVKMYVCTVMVILCLDSAFTTIGFFTLVQVYGLDEAIAIVHNTDLLETMVRLHLTAYSLVFLCCAPLDDLMLRILQRSSRLPILGWVLPSDVPSRYRPYNDRFRLEKDANPLIISVMLVPFLAGVVGRTLFRSEDSVLKQFLLGGLTVLGLKWGVKMYLKQKMMVRRKNMRILPYEPHPSMERQE
uniref:E3 ubiquitin-protein ligase MARCHF5 n=1 Tax=Graphocephala atropunctata TaxID=36148 RepID=A0A1B6M3A6_9HEMI